MLLPTLIAMALQSPTATITVHIDKPGIKISPDLYGIFFEEINCSGDGGLYAELVRNRSFEDPDKLAYWEREPTTAYQVAVDTSGSQGKEDPTALRLSYKAGLGPISVWNEGYWGIPFKANEPLSFSCVARSDDANAKLTISLVSPNGYAFDTKSLSLAKAKGWQTLRCELRPLTGASDAKLKISLVSPSTVWLDMVSLFPEDTFKGRPNGLRNDLGQMLADLHPSFMRFPGGCWVEGDTMALSQRWKQTIGDPMDRRTQYNIWQYMSTNGLGFHEYLQFCEDIGAAPLFVVNCGMSHKEVVPIDKMDEYVQDAVDAIEYANGPVTSKWGAVRAKNGHPAPFNLKYLEIGNENGGAPYRERFPLIARAVKSKFPDIQIIANVWGGYPKSEFTEIIDEHYYSNPNFFFENADRYDKYDRKGPKVYVGEYAVTEGCGGGNLIAAVGEAAFMTGMERNSDVVKMASYAPLFANVNHKTWNPDLINFDNHRAFGTPSYYVQQMFSQNRADQIFPTEVDVADVKKPTFSDGGIGVGTWGTQAEFKDIKVVSGGKTVLDSPDGAVLTNGLGNWAVSGGALAQTGNQDGTRAMTGSPAWSNYSLTMKARKTGGREGFLITFGMRDEKDWIWWNIGGWGNSRHALERSVNGGKSELGKPAQGSVETGRWYDIRVDYTPDRIRCYLDGKLIHDVTVPSPKPLHVVAGRLEATAETLIKIVNSGDMPIATRFNVIGSTGQIFVKQTVLTSSSPLDENTLDEPTKVAPVARRFSFRGSTFTRTIPPYSVTVLRMHRGT
jgi:alpha-L-arabinofuranosidase